MGVALGLALGGLCSPALAGDAARKPGRNLTPILGVAIWGALQLVPSPMLIGGTSGLGGGLRWQVTPFLYSFGVAAKPARFFIVAPVARHTGGLEFFGSPEWTNRAGPGESGWIGRAGTRLYWPLMGRGESLSMSLGGSYHYENRRHGGAGELGFYTLSSIVGISVTVAPWLRGREAMLAMTLHYF